MPLWLLQLVVGVALSLASTLIKQAFAPAANQQKIPGLKGQVSVGGDEPQSFLLGTVATSGHLEYANSWGEVNGTPNAYLTDVISLSDLPISGVTGLFVDGEKVTVSGTAVSQGTPVTEYQKDGADHLWQLFFDGTQTAASSYLTGKFSTDPDRPFSTDMIGAGVPYAVMTALTNRELFNGFPRYLFECQGIPVYDPRQDSTAGGAGTQRWADDSTWTHSDNLAVLIYNILRGIRYKGEWIYGPQSDPGEARLPYAEWAAAMDVCDQAIALNGGGTENRFRGGLEVRVDVPPIETVKELAKAANIRLAEAGGVWRILVAEPGAAIGSFTDADLLVTEGHSLDPFPATSETINGATATYYEPLEAWEAKETAPRFSATLEAEDDNRRLAKSLDLKAVFSNTQSQRVLQAVINDARRFRRHVIACPPKFGVYEPLDIVSWTSARNGYVAKLFLVTATTLDANGNVVLGLQEIDPADNSWTPASDEKAYSVAALTPSRPAPQPMSGWGVNGVSVANSDGSSQKPTLQISYAGPQNDVRAIHVQVRLASDQTVVFDGEAPYGAPFSVILSGNFLGNTGYEARGRFLPFSGRATDWSVWLSATTPDVGLGSGDLSKALRDLQDWIATDMRELRENVTRIGQLVAEQDGVNIVDRQTVKETITTRVGDVTAGYTQAIDVVATDVASLSSRVTVNEAAVSSNQAAITTEQTARADGDSANAISITALESKTADATANFLWKAETLAAQNAGYVRFGWRLSYDNGTSFQRAGFFQEVNGTQSITLFQNDEFHMLDSAGNAFASFWKSGDFSFG